ncbi:MAG: recombinase family protein [Saccharofermentanales bacterium]|jgi:DNA invertase Pin-like site-specific DNA recombinase
MSRYGYIRLDEAEVQLSRQALQLDTIGGFDRLFVEHQAVIDQWEQRNRLLNGLQSGDVIYTAAADRICNSLKDFLDFVQALEKIGADLVLLEEGLDTRTAAGQKSLRLLNSFQQLNHKAQSTRKKAGIAKARKKGRRIGRPPVSIPPDFRNICRLWSLGEISGREAMRRSGLKQTSFYKKAAELGYKPSGGKQADENKN